MGPHKKIVCKSIPKFGTIFSFLIYKNLRNIRQATMIKNSFFSSEELFINNEVEVCSEKSLSRYDFENDTI